MAKRSENKIGVVDNKRSQLSIMGLPTDVDYCVEQKSNNIYSEPDKRRVDNGVHKSNRKSTSVQNSYQNMCKTESGVNLKKPDIQATSGEMSSVPASGSCMITDMRDKTLNIRVYGVPEAPWSETNDDCIRACLAVCNEVLGVPITRDDIEDARRFGKVGAGGRPRPIIVKFMDREKRGDVLAAARRRPKQDGTGIVVGEDLTVPNYKLVKFIEFNEILKGSPSQWENISYRLSKRKKLVQRRRKIVNIACMLATLGIVSMIVECELYIQRVKGLDDVELALGVITTTSTLFLLASIILYHISGIQLTMVENSIEDWRLFTRAPLICCIIAELVVCAIQPLPGSLKDHNWPMFESGLGILMFLRLYLLIRYIVVHSSLGTNTATQSLGALNKVRIDTMFVFKALMSDMPGTLLITLMTIIFIVSTWSLRNCEAYEYIYLNMTSANERQLCHTLECAMWLSAITFLTVGYGDQVPKSECGKVTAVVMGLLGVGSTALLVAVLAQKLEQSRSEKYVHAFVRRVELDKRHKVAAANVIKNVLKLWRIKHLQRAATYRTGGNPNNMRDLSIAISNQYSKLHKKMLQRSWRINVYGKLLQAVREMRETKMLKAHIGESAVGLIEVNTGVTEVLQTTETISEQQELISARCESIENRLTSIEENLKKITQILLQDKTCNTDKWEPCPAN